jgi:tetratricopeptide (TPR) repeat protein
MLFFAFGCGNPDRQKMKHFQKGQILVKRNRHAEAVEEYQNALKIDPMMANAHYELGRCYAKLQHYDLAIESLNSARKLNPQQTLSVLAQIAEVYTQTERSLLAEKVYYEALSISPKDISVMTLLGNLKTEQKNFAEARSWYEKALEIDHNHSESRIALAEIAVLNGQYDEAERQLKIITTEIDPDHTAARLALAKVYRFSDRKNEAVSTLEAMLEDDPDNVTARGALAEAYYAVDRLDDARREAATFVKMSPTNLEAHSLLGVISLKQGDFESALSHLNRVVNSPSASAQSHYLLGLALRETGREAQATASFKKSLAKEPSSAIYRLALAQSLLKQGYIDNARREIESVLLIEPENELAKQLWAQADALDQAFEHLDALLASEATPSEVADKIKEGLRAFRAGNLVEAKSICEGLLESAPESALPSNLLGLIFLRQLELGRALTCFQRATNIDPEFAASYVNMANVYLASGSHEQAALTFKRAIEIAPRDQIIKFRYVKTLTALKRYDEAETYLRELIRDDPRNTAPRFALANMLISMRRYPEAREELSNILKQDPDHVLAPQLLALTFAKEGDAAAAARQFEANLRAQPNHLKSQHSKAMLALCYLVLDAPKKAEGVLPAQSGTDTSNDNSIRFVRALLMQKKGLNENAEKTLVSLRSDSPDEQAYELMLSAVRALQGKPERSPGESVIKRSDRSDVFRQSYQKLLQDKSLDSTDMFELNLGIALSQVRFYLLSVTELENIRTKASTNPALCEIIGGLWAREGNLDKSLASYQAAINADPAYWPAHYQIARHSLGSSKMESAERHFRLALEYRPDSLAILLGLARLNERMGNNKEAIQTYVMINELYPNMPSVLNNLAWLLAKDKATLDQALTYAEQAAVSQPFKAGIRDTLGWIYYQRGDYTKARNELDKAVLFDPADPTIRYHRGMSYLKLGDKDKAREDFEHGNSSGLPFQERKLNEEMIRKLS